MVPVGPNVAVVFLTKDGESQDVVYMLLEEDGRVLRTVKLTDTPKIDEQVVRLAPFGEHLLLAWQESEGVTKLAVIDARGRFRNRPATIKEPLPQNDDLVLFPNGDVGWLVGKTGDRQLRLVRVCR